MAKTARMHRHKQWSIADVHEGAAALAERLRTSPVLAQVLLNRGLSDVDECMKFLRPSLGQLPAPVDLPGVPAAAQRIVQAIHNKEKIVIYGDYDVDGITATSILWHAIRTLGGEADFYVPHRIEEGYGLNADAIGQVIDQGAQLIITVDCGITALEPVKVAKARGIDLIVTDHHEIHRDAHGNIELPDCFGVVHPRLPGSTYPNPHLCGAGVAFKLAWGVGLAMTGGARVSDEFRAFLVDATALAALGTIADVVPLVGENRVLAHFGLGGLKQTKLTGLKALIESANLTGQNLDSYHVGFLLGPRLNACGRMGHARLAVDMMTRATPETAREIADYLEQQNKDRQSMEKKILEQAMAQVEELGFDSDDSRAVVLGSEGWHPGVIGIVASRLVERLHRPVVMVAINNGIGQGSCRSIAGFHLAEALTACTEHLISHGGHEMAAGLKVDKANFEAFREAFCEHARQVVTDDMLVPRIELETDAELRQINLGLVQDLKRLGPFGNGNRRPLLCCRSVEVAAPPRRVGKTGDHIQIQVRQGQTQMKCIGFNMGSLFDDLQVGRQLDLAAEATINEFNGYVNVELELKDLRMKE